MTLNNDPKKVAPKTWATFLIFKNIPEVNDQPMYMRKFAQSGHPVCGCEPLRERKNEYKLCYSTNLPQFFIERSLWHFKQIF
jgi:hypothetical protein